MAESKSPRKLAIKNLSHLSKGRDATSESLHILYPFGILSKEPRNPSFDRDIVITMTVVLEKGLEAAIVREIGKQADADDMLFSGQSPIITDFGQKIRLAYVLGIIGPLTMADLGSIRAVRNAFAHTYGYLDFDVPEINAVLETIEYPNRFKRLMPPHTNQDQRERFIQTVFRMSLYLLVPKTKGESDSLIEDGWLSMKQ